VIAWVLIVALAAPAAALPSAHFARAQKLFAQGHFREALDEFTAASEAAPREVPDLWFDIGQCHRNLGNARQAVHAFRRYLALRPDAPDRARVVTMIEKLGGTVDDLPDPNREAKAAVVLASNANVSAVPAEPPPSPIPSGESPSPPASTLTPASDTPAAPDPARPSVELIPTHGPDAPPPKKRRTWPIWVGVGAAVASVAAVGIGLGVGLSNNSSAATMSGMHPMTGTNLGTSVTIDTRGH
jgi:tetratricopeptide (TPR) repeat protein